MQPITQKIYKWFDWIIALKNFFYHMILTTKQAIEKSRFLLHTAGKVRRLWRVHFRKEYVRSQLLVRKGECRQCGACCNLLVTCPMLTKQGLCFIYGTCRPKSCRVFPIDQKDIDEINLFGGHCGYRFDRDDNPNFKKIGRC